MEDNDTARSEGQVRTFPVYRTPLGDVLLPGDSFFSRQLRSRFSEMLVKHLAAGGVANLVTLGEALAAFTPADVLGDPDPFGWNERMLKQWEEEHRPHIFAALEAFFLDGGQERRVDAQHEFLRGLRKAGVMLGGAEMLADQIAYAGDWHETFMHYVLKGREHGIRLYSDFVDADLLSLTARKAGFTVLQAQMIVANIHPITAEATLQSTWWSRFFSRGTSGHR